MPNPDDFPASIFTNTSAFGLMDHADELRRWGSMGGKVNYYFGGGWGSMNNALFQDILVYRAVRPALIPFSVPDDVWRGIDRKWQWAARDANGRVYFYTARPFQGLCEWWHDDVALTRHVTDLFPGIIAGTVPWTEAICKRPKCV